MSNDYTKNREGEYLCTVTGQELCETREGKVFLRIGLDPEGGVDKGEATLWFTEKAAGRSKDTLEMYGWDGSFASIADGSWSLVGQQIKFECRHDEYNGSLREQWDFVDRPQGRRRATAETIARLERMFGKSAPAAPAKPPAKPAEPVTASQLDDDVPF